jgi:hypothetical protein
VSEAAAAPAPAPGPGKELYVRHARLDGRSVVLLRAVEVPGGCVVEAEVWPGDSHPYDAVKAGPYTFPNPIDATRFVTHAVEALIALGCDVGSS